MDRYRKLSAHLRQRFGKRVQRIPLDAGFDCPNRDGTLSRSGCVFCNERGSGSGLGEAGLSLPGQWAYWTERLGKRYKTDLFLAYLQSYSNTHGPLEKIRSVLDQIETLPGLAGICLGTRPDCLDGGRLEEFARRNIGSGGPSGQERGQQTTRDTDFGDGAGFGDSADFGDDTDFGGCAGLKMLDMGLQSANDQTLRRINRGHDFACFARACHKADELGVEVCAHVIAGLPDETDEDVLATVDAVNTLPVKGIKFHNLYVCEGSPLAAMWRRGEYAPLTLDGYAALLARALNRLRPDIVVHRITGDPAPGELLAPEWAGKKREVLAAIERELDSRDVIQGKDAR